MSETQINNVENKEDKTLITYLDADNSSFILEESGYLKMQYNGDEYKRLILKRLLPHMDPNNYISVVQFISAYEEKEIGIIKDLNSFKDEKYDMLKKQLDYFYYTAEITKINSAKERMGYLYVEAIIANKVKRFCVSDFSTKLLMIKNMILITDIEGNHFKISDINTFDKPSYAKIEVFL